MSKNSNGHSDTDTIKQPYKKSDKKALQYAITRGIQSGQGGTLDMNEIKRIARRQAGR